MEIVTALAAFLGPFVPYLVKAGQPVAEGAGKKLGEKMGEGTWEKAKALWGKLWPKAKANPMAKGSAEQLAANPDDEDLQVTFRAQLKQLLKDDAELTKVLAEILQEGGAKDAGGTTIIQTASGQDAQQIGRVEGGSKVIRDVTGDVTM